MAAGPPDLFCMAMLTRFVGYYPQYSRDLAQRLDCLTWLVLKAHTRNRAGEVTLRSANPRVPPAVNFRYFDEGGDDDIAAVVDGVRFVRRVAAPLREQGVILDEELPGPAVQSDDDFAPTSATPRGATTRRARARLARGGRRRALQRSARARRARAARRRCVGLSEDPGFFIVSAVYMLAEKAADAVLTDTKRPAATG